MSVVKKEAKKSKTKRPITWPEAIDLYELHLRAARKAESTIRGYAFELRRFSDHLERAPEDVSLDDLRRYQAGLLDGSAARTARPQGVATVHRITTTLAGFFSFLVAEGKLERDPSLRLERPKLPDKLVGDVLSVKEVERLLDACDETTPKGLRDRALVELLYASGLRRNEALGLDLADLDHDERQVRVHGKGGKGRIVPVTRSAWLRLAAYLERARPLLATDHSDSGRAVFLSTLGRRVSEPSVLKLLRTLRIAARIRKNVTPHTLRRTFATHLLKEDVSLRHIQALLGHSNLNTTARYLRLDASELRRQLLLHHPRERFLS